MKQSIDDFVRDLKYTHSKFKEAGKEYNVKPETIREDVLRYTESMLTGKDLLNCLPYYVIGYYMLKGGQNE